MGCWTWYRPAAGGGRATIPAGGAGCEPGSCSGSELAVEVELVRMRPELDFLGAGPLEGEPGLDDVGREDVAAVQELLVCLERIERLFERARSAGDVGLLLGGHLVDVAVDRCRRLDLVHDSVEAGHQLRAE